jgi:REP element-mobilizing transposase RayT
LREKVRAERALSGVAFYRRNLPHWHPCGKALFITWRLHRDVGDQHYLARPEIAEVVAEAIRYAEWNLRYYDLHAWIVMSNHVHLLVDPLVEPAAVLNTLKNFTARHVNVLLHRTGASLWQREYFDHWIRSQGEFKETAAYIEANPVRAGLVNRPEDFRWSSAFISK